MPALVARQEIFDSALSIHAYELLFRAGVYQDGLEENPAKATATVIANTWLTLGEDRLLDGKPAFVNLPRESLLSGVAEILPPSRVVLEILETVTPDAAVVAACGKLKAAGYQLALDDFDHLRPPEPLIGLADYIKVDLLATPAATCARMAEKYGRRGIRMLAEKVETAADYERSRSHGYQYFQGYFLREPQLFQGAKPPAFPATRMRILAELQQPEMDLLKVRDLVKLDVSLIYRVLRYVNSVMFVRYAEVTDLTHAITLLGQSDLRRLLKLALLADLGAGMASATLAAALVRGVMCESLLRRTGYPAKAEKGFLAGVLSLLGVILHRSTESLLAELRPGSEVSAAVLGGDPHEPLAATLRLVTLYEKADWDEFDRLREQLAIPPHDVAAAYREGLIWARDAERAAAS